MKKGILILVMCLLVSSISLAQEYKIGHVNYKDILYKMPEFQTQEFKQSYAKLEESAKHFDNEVQRMRKEYEGNEQLPRMIENFKDSAFIVIDEKLQELEKSMRDKLNRAIDEVGKENNYKLYL